MRVHELLAISGIQKDCLPNSGVKLNVHRMEYPFFARMFFQEGDRRGIEFEDFQRYIRNLAGMYMVKWLSTSEKRLNKDLYALYDFQKEIDMEKIFAQIVNGEINPAEILLRVSNIRMEMRRFGNCLGIKVKANNDKPNEIHKNGTNILENFCQERAINIKEFLRCIECIIPLSRMHVENSSIIVDFRRTFEAIKIACPYIKWHGTQLLWDDNVSLNVKDLVSMYTAAPEGDVLVGSFLGERQAEPNLFFKLVHLEENSTNKQIPWRKRNIVKLDNSRYKFIDGKDLCLSLRIKGFFSESISFEEVDTTLNVDSQQDKMWLSGETLYWQLYYMTKNLFSSIANY